MKFFKKLDLPIFNNLYTELLNLLENNKIKWNQDGQICINTITSEQDDYNLGTGSLYQDWKKSYSIVEHGIKKIIVPPRDFPLTEKDFTEICTPFKNTVFEELISMLKKNYSIGRVRIMKSEPKSCLSWHTDYSPRIHFPIKTQEGCCMVIQNELLHMPFQTWWWADTSQQHTAFNASKQSRIHVVASIIEDH